MSATASQPLMLRLLSASACAANRAGGIIRDVLKSGKLGVVEKVLDIGFLGRIMRYVSMFFIGGFTNFFFYCKVQQCSESSVYVHVSQGYDDPQTEADRRAQRCIMATLRSRFPKLTVIGEEEVRNLL